MLASSLFKFYSNIHFLYFLLRYETCQLKGVVWDGSSSYSNIEANNVLCCHTPTSHKIGTNQDIWLNIWASNIHFSVLAVALWNLSIKGNKFSSYSNIEANNVLCCHPPTSHKIGTYKSTCFSRYLAKSWKGLLLDQRTFIANKGPISWRFLELNIKLCSFQNRYKNGNFDEKCGNGDGI